MQNCPNAVKYWLCLITLLAVNAFIQSPQPSAIASRCGVYTVHINGVTCLVGTSFPDDELSNRTLPFDASEKFISVTENTSKLNFPPNYANFTEQEIGIAAYEVVTITNTSPSQSLYLISIQASSFTLLFKPINVATLEPRQLPNKVGHINTYAYELYVETNSTLARYKVYGFSTTSKYAIRLLKAERIDLSTKYRFCLTFFDPHLYPIEVCQLSLRSFDSELNEESQAPFLSPENSLCSKIDDLSIHAFISLAEQGSNGLDKSNFLNKLSKSLRGCICGIISPADTLVNSEDGKRCPRFIYNSLVFPGNSSKNIKIAPVSLNPAIVDEIGDFSTKVVVVVER
ncbi:unnamed protein product, partial [Hymenolepis diminuta]